MKGAWLAWKMKERDSEKIKLREEGEMQEREKHLKGEYLGADWQINPIYSQKDIWRSFYGIKELEKEPRKGTIKRQRKSKEKNILSCKRRILILKRKHKRETFTKQRDSHA